MKNSLLDGRYRILDRLGEGGMAFVYLALDEKLDRQVAIKILHEHMASNQEIRERFFYEARAVSSLDHPNVVKVFDFSGENSQTLWIVTEVLRGMNLAQFAKRHPSRQIHPALACILVREITRALEAAHINGIVHRDIKPENVMLTESGQIKLMDFGISKSLQRHSLTMTGTFMGSPSYMSPEQTRGQDIDHRTDIYSLGVVFYELLTGRLPFTGQSTAEVVTKIAAGTYSPPRCFVPMLDPSLEAVVTKAMALSPASRHQHVVSLGQDIDGILISQGFVESHVELQRYSADRLLFERRLAAVTALGGSSPVSPSPSSPRTTKISRPEQSEVASSPTPAPVPPAKANPSFVKTVLVEPAAIEVKSPTALPPKNSQPVYPSPTKAAPPPIARPPRVRVAPRRETSHLGQVFLGLALLALLAAVGLRLQRPTKTSLPPKVPVAIESLDRPVAAQVSAPPRDTPQPATPGPATSATPAKKKNKILAAKGTTQRPPATKVPKHATTAATRTTPKAVAPSRPVKEAMDRLATSPLPPPSALPLPPVDIDTDTPTDALLPGAFQIASRPASDIFVDGIRVGTSIDRTVSSGWIPVPPGRHTIELRRKGYRPARLAFNAKSGQRETLATVDLLAIAEAPAIPVTIRSNRPGSVYSVQGLDSEYRASWTIAETSLALSLPAGRYLIRVQFKDLIKERTLVLSQNMGPMTMAVDFPGGGKP